MRLQFACLLFLVFFYASVHSQVDSCGPNQNRVDPNSPSVYLTVHEDDPAGELKDRLVSLRLHNNLSSPIWIEASGGVPSLGTISAYYEFYDRKEDRLTGIKCTVCSVISIAPGKFVKFGIPKDSVSKEIEVRVPFWFDSESTTGGFQRVGEPLHYAWIKLNP